MKSRTRTYDSVSMEFLLTYGWAILVVLVAIGALAYFGIFNVNIYYKTNPDKCVCEQKCEDFIGYP